MINKKILLFIIFISLMFIPLGFASDVANENLTSIDEMSSVDVVSVENNKDEVGALANVLYFDASASSEGSGSQSSPYKTFSASKLGFGDTSCYFAPGTYTFSDSVSFFYGSLELIGNNPSNTVLRYTGDGNIFGSGMSSINSINIKGITISGLTLNVNSAVDISNSIIENAKGISNDKGNTYGGAISLTDASSKLTVDNSIFRNNKAEYGGAIYLKYGTATITNSKFVGNSATQFGGTIAAENGANVIVKNSEFDGASSHFDAGASIYLKNSQSTISYTNFTNLNSYFGSAVTALNSSVNADHILASNNNASYEGGAIYSMYGSLKVTSSVFNSNSAKYGGAIFADNLTSFECRDSIFNDNSATNTAGAIYALANIKNTVVNPTYNGNKAGKEDDYYESRSFDLIMVSDDYETMIYNPSSGSVLPAKYDLRDYGYVSSVKNQEDSGNCWAYASIAALESCILKATGKEYDLSEGNLKNLAQYFSDYGWDYETNEGGFYRMATGYLTGWLGPVLESEDLTDDKDFVSAVFDSLMHVQNVLYIQRTSYTDNNAIKRAIMDYGAVATEIFFRNSGSYYSPSTGGYYYYDGNEINHAVIIVGWDDTYSRNNFPRTPAGDGAFIIKNSYGNQWGKDNSGFGYVSYYDTAFARFNLPYSTFTFILNDTVKYNKNYQYETTSWTDYFVTGKKSIYYKNEFISTGNDLLSAFSTYFNATKTNWEAKIYVNDQLVHTQSGVANQGYYTINLDSQIPLNTGDKFAVALKISCNGFASFPISENTRYGSTRMNYMPGVSFFSYDGETWHDLYDYKVSDSYGHKYSSQVACIKAFTSDSGDDSAVKTKIEITQANSNLIVASIKTVNNALVSSGNVTFDVDGNVSTVSLSNGRAELKTSLKPGIHKIIATYNGNDKFESSATSKDIEIDRESLNVGIDAQNINYGENLIIRVTLTNSTGSIVNLPITISVDGKSYLVTKGNLNVSNLKPGNYVIQVKSAGSDNYAESFNNASVNVAKIHTSLALDVEDIVFGENASISVTLDDVDDAVLKVKVNDKDYDLKIEKGKGFLSVPDLKVGNHSIFVSFEGNEYYLEISNSTSFNVGKATPNIVTSADDVEEGEIAVINIKLNDDIGGVLTVQMNEKQYLAFINNGKASVKVPNLNAGKYSYDVLYNGDDKYIETSVNGRFEVIEKYNPPVENDTNVTPQDNRTDPVPVKNDTNVTPIENNTNVTPTDNSTANDTNDSQDVPVDSEIFLNAPDVVKYFSSSERFIVHVTDSKGNGLDNVAVNIQINGNEYTRTTNKDGVASIGINLNSGSYNVTTICDNITLNSKVIIKDTVSANDLEKVYRNSSQFYATFVDGEGNLIRNTAVSFNINGVWYERMTNASGVARLNINLAQGEYVITSVNPITKENRANNIKVLSTIVDNHDLVKYYRNASQYVIRLVNSDGSYAGANVTAKFNINGVFYERKTNSTGHVKLNLNLEPGDYIITAEYNGCKVSNNIKILTVLKSHDLTMRYRDGSRFNVNVYDGQGNPAAGEKITFNINGVFYNRYANSQGIASLNINLQSGEYIITSSYNGLNVANKVTIY